MDFSECKVHCLLVVSCESSLLGGLQTDRETCSVTVACLAKDVIIGAALRIFSYFQVSSVLPWKDPHHHVEIMAIMIESLDKIRLGFHCGTNASPYQP